MKKRYAACTAMAMMGLVGAAVTTKAQVLDEITVTGSALGSTDAASEGSVDAAKLKEFPTYRPGEYLESVPGLIVTQHSGEGKANQYFLRGFNLDHGTDIDITLDGMPVNMRTHAHGQGYADLNFMIPELVQGIDYSKGPYYADKGDFDTAGAVTIDYVDTLPHDLASISAGTLGDYRGFTGMSRPVGQGPWGIGNFLMAAEYDRVDGPWVLPDNFNKGNLVLRYSQGAPANGFAITGMFMDDAWHATNQVPLRAVNDGQINLYGPLDPTDGGSAERYSLSGRFAQTDDDGQFKLSAYFINNALKLINNFDAFVTFPPPIGDQFIQQERRQVVGADTSYTKFGSLFDRQFDNTVGFQTRTDFNHMGLAQSLNGSPTFTVRNDRILETSGGLYAENRTRWIDWFRTVAGAREDIFYGSDASAPIAENSGTTAKGMFSPKANATFGPWQKTELYLSYGQGFHSNDLRGAVATVDALDTELNQQAGVTPATVPQGKTPLLTKAEGYEVGIRSEVVPQVTMSAALFVLDLASEATFDGDSAGTAVGRPSRRTGVELSGSYTPLDWLSFTGDFAFTHARFTNADDGSADVWPGHPGSYIPEAAKMIASAEMAIQNLGPWDGGVRMRYFGPRPLTEDASIRSGPTLLFDARAGYRFTPVWHVQLDIFNLFYSHAHQIDYFYPSQLANEPAPVFDINFKPVEPLSARLTLAASF
ncbi:MAG TPA: TonB-dependent receptor [Stellaceae bacterium]|nr:TonB-dependent receptor [Stellaceae bacterium]